MLPRWLRALRHCDSPRGFEVSVGAGSLSVVGGEAVLLATGASTMGASAVWLSVEVMAMARGFGFLAGSGGVRRGYIPLASRPLDLFRARFLAKVVY